MAVLRASVVSKRKPKKAITIRGNPLPPRRPEIRTESDAISELARRVRTLEDTVARRVLPPGYEFGFDSSGDIFIRRVADGLTDTIATF